MMYNTFLFIVYHKCSFHNCMKLCLPQNMVNGCHPHCHLKSLKHLSESWVWSQFQWLNYVGEVCSSCSRLHCGTTQQQLKLSCWVRRPGDLPLPAAQQQHSLLTAAADQHSTSTHTGCDGGMGESCCIDCKCKI